MGLSDLVGRDGRDDEFWNFILSGCCNGEVLWRSDYLCLARRGSRVEENPDIGDVVEYTADGGQKIVDVTVVGDMQLDLKKVCSNCKGRFESLPNSIGKCIKCLMMQKIDTCSDQICAGGVQCRIQNNSTRIWTHCY